MKKKVSLIAIIFIVVCFILVSCNNQANEIGQAVRIENTLQSVSYMQDTAGMDPQIILKALNNFNQAIEEIGYPDAGYKLWIIQDNSSEIRFMIEGFWPDQNAYTLIHEHDLYKRAAEENIKTIESGLKSVEYHRFRRVK